VNRKAGENARREKNDIETQNLPTARIYRMNSEEGITESEEGGKG